MAWLSKNPEVVGRVVLLPVDQIEANPYQPRKEFDSEAIEQLAVSIAANGLLQPILVRPAEEGGYQLVAGERRLRACRALGMKTIPSIVRPMENSDSAVLALVENLQRTDLNCFEEAQAISSIMELCHYSQQQAARLLGRSQPAVANKLRLLRLGDPVRRVLLGAGLGERYARALLCLEDSRQLEAAKVVVQRGLNVAQAEEYIQHLSQAVPPTRRKGIMLRDARLLFNSLAKAVNTMKASGFEVEALQTEDEEYISYVVRIPRGKVYASA